MEKERDNSSTPSLCCARRSNQPLDGILFTDKTGHILHFNERYLQMWGIGREVAEHTAQHRQLLESHCEYLKDPQQFLENTAEIYATWPEESRDLMALADSRVFERYSRVQYIGGKSIGRGWSFRDVTACTRVEEALRETDQRMSFMADAMPQKIFTARADGTFDYLNQQWQDYTGLTLRELMDWGWTRLIHADDVDETLQCWLHSVGTGEPYQMECRFRQATGDYRWHLLRAQARRESGGVVSMWVGSNTDIDRLKRADEEKQQLLKRERIARVEAEHASNIKDEFLATLR